MSILTRYIATELLRGWLITLVVIASVFGLLGFISELDSAVGDYNTPAIARYSLLVLPQQLLSLAPVIMLLGTILAFASLQRGSELTVISCAGIAVSRLVAAVSIPTMVVMLLLWIGMEYVTAPLHQQAEEMRQRLRQDNLLALPKGGLWSRDGRRYIHLSAMRAGRTPADIELYQFDASGRLERALHAADAAVGNNRIWQFRDVQEKVLTGEELVTRRLSELSVGNLWAARELPVLTLSQDSMRLSVLLSYGTYLASNQRDAKAYLSTFWQRLVLPLTAAAMVLLATPVSAGAGSTRGRNIGASLALGALIGIGFYLGSQIVSALGQLLNLSLPLVALLPALAITLCALLLLRRMHW